MKMLNGQEPLISIHAPLWGATQGARARPQAHRFQSTLPCGERPMCWAMTTKRDDFNPRSPVGSDYIKGNGYTLRELFQSTLPCGERQSCATWDSTANGISIHAPLWGATVPLSASRPSQKLFQSTLPCGERHASWRLCFFRSHFNPRSPVGSDSIRL